MFSSTISSFFKPLRVPTSDRNSARFIPAQQKKLASGRNNDLCFAVSLSVSACGRQALYVVTKRKSSAAQSI